VKIRNTHILLFYSKKRKNAPQVKEKICRVYGEDALTRQIAANWFRRLEMEILIKDVLYSDQPIVENVNKI